MHGEECDQLSFTVEAADEGKIIKGGFGVDFVVGSVWTNIIIMCSSAGKLKVLRLRTAVGSREGECLFHRP